MKQLHLTTAQKTALELRHAHARDSRKSDRIKKEHAKKLNIQLHFLPPYSPNLNPVERLWKVMNEQVSCIK